MFMRDPFTANLMPGGTAWIAPGLGDYAADEAEWSRLLKQLHGAALSIVQGTQDAARWSQQGMTGEAQMSLEQVRTMRGVFASILERMRPVAERLGNVDLSPFDRFLFGVGTWIEQSVNALPRAIAALPNAVLDALADFLKHAGEQAVGAILPWLLGAGLVFAVILGGVKHAERTRTYRHYVA
jgi:hypothetical protein